MSKRFFQRPLFLAFVLIFGFQVSFGCMYGPPYRTVCETYAQAASVIIGKIEDVESYGSSQKVVINVKKTFKGENKSRIILNQPQSTCDWDFSGYKGKTLLLYLFRNNKTGRYSAIAEGAGGELKKTSEDLY